MYGQLLTEKQVCLQLLLTVRPLDLVFEYYVFKTHMAM